MSAREVLEDTIAPLFERVDDEIYRFGTIRFFTGALILAVSMFAATAPFGVAVGLWVAAGFLIVVILAIALASLSGARRLRDQERLLTRELAEYGRVLQEMDLDAALAFRSQSDHVTIDKSGNSKWVRTITLGASSESIPHYVRSGFTADVPMDPRRQRSVRCVASHIRNGNTGVRILLTKSWEASSENHTMLVAHAYVGRRVEEGDQVRFEVTWPHASKPLRAKKDSEPFTMFFRNRAFPIECKIVLKGCREAPALNEVGSCSVRSAAAGDDWECVYRVQDPQVGDRVGFDIDLRSF